MITMTKTMKIVMILIIGICMIGVVCMFQNKYKDNNNKTNNDVGKTNLIGESKTLIVYFSLPENNGEAKEDSTISINGETIGNTEYVAMLLEDKLQADIFRIIPVKEYNVNDHQALIDDALEEQNNNARPEIKDTIQNFDNYDTIFIGYPIWWSDMPQIIYTFLESYNFEDKNIYVFSTNGGSGLAGTVNTITKKIINANVNPNAFELDRNEMDKAPEKVEKWLQELGK